MNITESKRVGGLTMDEAMGMPDSELIRAFDRLTGESDDIDLQLADAKAEKIRTGRFSDAAWFQRAEAAARIKRRQLNMISQEFKRRKTMTNQAVSASFDRAFVAVAKEEMNDHDFTEMVDRANRIIRNEESWPG